MLTGLYPKISSASCQDTFNRSVKREGIIMSKVLDQTGDLNGQQTHRLLTQFAVPEFVKEASSDALYGEDLPVHCYADPINRQFPYHTKEATLMSAMFLWDNNEKMSTKIAATIEAALEKKAKFHGV